MRLPRLYNLGYENQLNMFFFITKSIFFKTKSIFFMITVRGEPCAQPAHLVLVSWSRESHDSSLERACTPGPVRPWTDPPAPMLQRALHSKRPAHRAPTPRVSKIVNVLSRGWHNRSNAQQPTLAHRRPSRGSVKMIVPAVGWHTRSAA